MRDNDLEIRECVTLDELEECVRLQRTVFRLPDTELSPVRHLVVTKNAGGFTLGTFENGRLIGFVLSVPAFLRGERAFYSHMTAVESKYQGSGIGARLKWAQRKRAMDEGVRYIKWTFEPVKARNAYFNLEKLGAVVAEYEVNFYGIDYGSAADSAEKIGLASDRLFAEWDLKSVKVETLERGEPFVETKVVERTIAIPFDWDDLIRRAPRAALDEQLRVRGEFQTAFASGLVVRGFDRGENPHYLLYDG